MTSWLMKTLTATAFLGACAAAPAGSRTAGLGEPPKSALPRPANEARTPQALVQRFGQCVQKRDLAMLTELYEANALFVPRPGTVATGKAAIRAALRDVLALNPTLIVNPMEVHVVGDVALVRSEWKLSGTAPDGAAVAETGTSSVVMRRQNDGNWRFVIDRP